MHDPKITPAFLKVAWAYCLHINSETGAAWPKIKTITDLTGVCGKTVSRARKYFGLKWHVTEERRPGKSLICYPQPKDVPGQQDVSTHGTDPGQVVVPTGVDNKMSRGSGQQDVHRLLNTQRLTLNRGLLIEGFARIARRTARSRSQKRRKRLGEEARTTKAWTPSISSRPRLPQWEAWSKIKRWPQTDSHVDGRIKRGWWFPSEWPSSEDKSKLNGGSAPPP
jgi:hypothetical protein